MRKYLLLFIVFFTIQAFAQHRASVKIIGYVKNADGKALADATVYIKNTAYSTSTDKDGHYILVVVPGKYEIIGSKVGFLAHKEFATVNTGENKYIQFDLNADPSTTLDQVVVAGKSGIQEVRESPFNVVALDAKARYNSTMNLTDLLAKASGVKIRQAGGLGSDVNIAINGFTGRNIKIFMDGVPMQGTSSSFQLNNIPVSLAERIEIYKGVIPIEFGSDALGGVINIVTNQSTNSFVDASYSYGTYNTHRTNIIVGHTTPKGFSFQLNGYQNYSDNSYKIKSRLKTNGNTSRDTMWFKRFHGGYHNEGVVAKVGWVNKPWADRFFIGATLSQDYKEIQNAPGNIETVYGDVFQKSKGLQPTMEFYKRDLLIKGLTARVTANYNFSRNSTVDTSSYSYNWLGERIIAVSKGERGVAGLSDSDNSNYSGTANLSYRINDQHAITLNDIQTGFVRNVVSDLPEESLSEFEKLKRHSSKNVLGLSYRYRHSRSWNVNAFGKNYLQKVRGPYNSGDEAHPDYQEKSVSYNKIGYGIASTYFWREFQFKASWERAYRLPSDRDLFGDETEEVGNTALKPESSMNYNLGVTMNKEVGSAHVIYVDVNGYYRDTKDFIRTTFMPRSQLTELVNFGKTRTLGVDLEARYYFKNIATIGGTYTFMNLYNNEKMRDAASGTVENSTYKDHMPNIPYNFGNLEAGYYLHHLGGKDNILNLTYSFNYVGKFYLNFESLGDAVNGGEKYALPTQISHDFGATYMVKNGKYNFTFEVQNLTGAELADNFGMLKPGRAIYGKVRFYVMKRTKNQQNR